MKRYLQIKIFPVTVQESEILVAELSDIGYYAFMEEKDALLAFITEEGFSQSALKDLLLPKNKFEKKTIIERDWNEQWEKNFKPVVIDDLVGVRADFHDPIPGVKYEIIVTPKMSFGTGHHQTTAMMVRLMNRIEFQGKSVIDFGTGTGILAILASMKGAIPVTGIDNDVWSISNAQENIKANHCSGISIRKEDDVTKCTPADILLANINFPTLFENIASFSQKIKKDGYLLLSGILASDRIPIEERCEKKGFRLADALRDGEWIALMFRRN